MYATYLPIFREMRKTEDRTVFKAAAAEIKAQRARLDISQEELAHRADVHRCFVARLEVAQTQPSLAVFLRLADALEVDPADMVKSIVKRLKKERKTVPSD